MVLGFVARRLYAERVVLVFAVRRPAGQVPALAGLPERAVGGLDEAAALELLAALAPGRLSRRSVPGSWPDRPGGIRWR